jgi:pyridoxamine 5'-phosphate oxidase
MSLQDLRQEYDPNPVQPGDLDACPFVQFEHWFVDAQRAAIVEPNAFTLATVDAEGQPHARTLLLKGLDAADRRPRGLVFYTNYGSDKGQQLADEPRCSMNFWWGRRARCVRVTGRAERVDRQETEAYFATRPRGSQLGAWCSEQSQVIESRRVLTQRYGELDAQYPEAAPIPVPAFWGGYRVVPESFEFWQGQPSRLHDRLRYRPADGGEGWVIERLSP